MGGLPVTESTEADSRPLYDVPAGTAVTAFGSVSAVNLFGTEDLPHAKFALTLDSGEFAVVDVDADTYPLVFGLLVKGQRIRVRGTAQATITGLPYIQGAGFSPQD